MNPFPNQPAAPDGRAPGLDPELLRELEAAARSTGKLGWSRRYAEIVARYAARRRARDVDAPPR